MKRKLDLAMTLVATWYGVYYLARSPRAQPVAFAFGGEARRGEQRRHERLGGDRGERTRVGRQLLGQRPFRAADPLPKAGDPRKEMEGEIGRAHV